MHFNQQIGKLRHCHAVLIEIELQFTKKKIDQCVYNFANQISFFEYNFMCKQFFFQLGFDCFC